MKEIIKNVKIDKVLILPYCEIYLRLKVADRLKRYQG